MKKLIKTDAAGLRSPYEGPAKDLDVALVDIQDEDHPIRLGKPMVFSSAEFNEGLENADEDVKELINAGGGGGTGVKLTVNPSTSDRTYTPSTGEYYNEVEAKGVTSAIDANIDPANIKEGVTILGVTGTYVGGGIIERDVLDTANAYSEKVDIDIQYEYHEPSEWEDPDAPNWKELDIYAENTDEENVDVTNTVLSVVTTADYHTYKWSMFMNSLIPEGESEAILTPHDRIQLGSVGNASEPEEGEEPDPSWTKINAFVEAAKEGDITTTTDIFTNDDTILTNGVQINPDITTDWDCTINLMGNKDEQGTHTDDIALIHWDYIGVEDPAPWYEDFDQTYRVALVHYISGEYFYYPLDVYISGAQRYDRTSYVTGQIPQELLDNNEDWTFEMLPQGTPLLDDNHTGGEEASTQAHPYIAWVGFNQPVQLLENYTIPTFTDPTDPEKVITPVNIYVDPEDKYCLVLEFDRPSGTDWVHNFTGTLTVSSSTVTTIIGNNYNNEVVIDDFLFSEVIN